MYDLLSGYQNTGDEFEIEDIDSEDIVNELNLTCATISVVMMKDEEESKVLLNDC